MPFVGTRLFYALDTPNHLKGMGLVLSDNQKTIRMDARRKKHKTINASAAHVYGYFLYGMARKETECFCMQWYDMIWYGMNIVWKGMHVCMDGWMDKPLNACECKPVT